jgi:hypothetical protein
MSYCYNTVCSKKTLIEQKRCATDSDDNNNKILVNRPRHLQRSCDQWLAANGSRLTRQTHTFEKHCYFGRYSDKLFAPELILWVAKQLNESY